MAETFPVVARGIGRPDYAREIDKIKRGETYPQFEPRPDSEKYKIFVGVFLPTAPLAIGATFHLIDIETNLATPYDSPAGFIADFREWFFALDGKVGFLMDLDGIMQFYMVPDSLATVHEYEQIVWGKSSLFDPNALSAHTWDFSIKNLDDHVITGAVHTALALVVK